MFYMSDTVPFAGMKLFLSIAKGIDVKTFDARGRKTLMQLHDQLMIRDLVGVILIEDSSSAILEKMRKNLYRTMLGKEVIPIQQGKGLFSINEEMVGRLLLVRTTVKIHVECGDFELREVMRAFTKDGVTDFVPELKDCANSETRYRGESVLECACRAARQELGMEVEPEKFEEDLSEEAIGEVHESSVYAGALSQQISKSVTLRLAERRWPNGRMYVDDAVEIYQQWFPKKDMRSK